MSAPPTGRIIPGGYAGSAAPEPPPTPRGPRPAPSRARVVELPRLPVGGEDPQRRDREARLAQRGHRVLVQRVPDAGALRGGVDVEAPQPAGGRLVAVRTDLHDADDATAQLGDVRAVQRPGRPALLAAGDRGHVGLVDQVAERPAPGADLELGDRPGVAAGRAGGSRVVEEQVLEPDDQRLALSGARGGRRAGRRA